MAIEDPGATAGEFAPTETTLPEKLRTRYILFKRAMETAKLSEIDLWIRYAAAGGAGEELDVLAFLYGMDGLSATEQDIIASVINQRLDEVSRVAKIPILSLPEEDQIV